MRKFIASGCHRRRSPRRARADRSTMTAPAERLAQLPGRKLPADRSRRPLRRRCEHRRNASVSAQGSQKLLDRTIVEVQGDKLVIHPQEHHSFFNFSFGSHGNAHFAVTVPQLTGATIAGSGGIKVDHVQGAVFEGTVAGSGGLDVTVSSPVAETLDRWLGQRQGGRRQSDSRPNIRSADRATSKRAQFRPQQAKVSIAGLREHRGECDRHGRRQHHGVGRCRPSPAVPNAR